ncbi:MAG: flagellar hook-associated protein FlgK [Paracoccaceae bacterium]
MSDIYGIARSGLQAYKEGLATTGQNIANVGNESYSRREAPISEVKSGADALQISNSAGYGVKVDGITRAFDEFIDIQLQNAASGFSFSTSQATVLNQLEQVLRPSQGSVSQRLQELFSSFNIVAQDPSDLAARHVSVDNGKAVVSSIITVADGISDLRNLVSDSITDSVSEANGLLNQLTEIQQELLGNEAIRNAPNDLLDQRDSLLRDLSELIEISVDYKSGGMIDVSVGTAGQGKTLLSGVVYSKLVVQESGGTSKVFLNTSNGGGLSKIQLQSGEISGNLAADISLVETKSALDEMTRKLVSEFNELHKLGTTLDGDLGSNFFNLEGVEITKAGDESSSSQISVAGLTDTKLGESFTVAYDASEEIWSLKNNLGVELGNFENHFDFDGIMINIAGQPSLGDKFNIDFTEGLSENLTLQLKDGRDLAASSFYLVEIDSTNASSTELSISKFEEPELEGFLNLSEVFSGAQNSANTDNFLNNGLLGVFENIDSINNLTSIQTQPKIQFGEDITGLDANTTLTLKLDGTNRNFVLGTVAGTFEDYSVLAEYLNTGAIRSNDADALSFSDLGLFAGGNSSTLNITSASTPNYALLTEGTFGNSEGFLFPADPGDADIQIFTREGVQLAGKPLTQVEAASIIAETNGFYSSAEYNASYLATNSDDKYIGADIQRLTTDGNFVTSISGLGLDTAVNSNLSVGANAAYPTQRAAMADPLEISTLAGATFTFEAKSGMMAGNIADGINQAGAQYGLSAAAFNQIELFDIGDVTIQFELIGDNAEAIEISASVSNGSTSDLVSEINSHFESSGVLAFASGSGAIILQKNDGNDISARNIVTSDASAISVRQLDEFGEVIDTASDAIPISVASGEYIISGGQIRLTSTASFEVNSGVNTADNANSEFISGFVQKKHDEASNSTEYEFNVFSSVDSNNHDADLFSTVAASSSYKFSMSTDNTNEENTVTIKPKSSDQLSPTAISEALVSELRTASIQTKFVGNEFEFADGFPEDRSTIEFQLGDQSYFAVLKNDLSYTVDGANVIIDEETLSQADALERLVRETSFDISGPEEDRIYLGFENSGSGFRLYASAKDGILSGDGLRLSENNSAAQKSALHLDNNVVGTTVTTIMGNEFDLTQAAQLNFAQVLSGNTSFDLDFDPAVDPKVSPAAPIAGISVTIEDLGNNMGRLVVSIDQSTVDLDVRLKANDNSTTFGILTSSSQITLGQSGFAVSNHDSERVTTSAEVNSLANTIFNVDALAGEDLIIYAKGTGKISLMGDSTVSQSEIDKREITARASIDTSNTMELFDSSSGDYLGTRELSSSNNFFFRNFDWQFNGSLVDGDTFNVTNSTARKDDASNLLNLAKLAETSNSTGKGGYSQLYNDLVMDVGFNLRSSEQGLETAKIIYDSAVDRKSEFSGVDLDTEAARLLEQQQAYQALAKVLSTAKEMVDTLLRFM